MKNRVFVIHGSNIVQNNKIKNNKNIVSEVFKDYCSNATIHGIGYLAHKDRSLPEKIWWIIVVILSVICCCHLISKTWIKWKTNPVILSFEQEQTAVWRIPFPAVTVCPVNKIKQIQYNYTRRFRKRDKLVGKDKKKFWDISLVCNLEEYAKPFNYTYNITDEAAINNIRSVAPPLSETFSEIYWRNRIYSEGEKLFTEQLTQEGLCFTFNSFSQEDMYTSELNQNTIYINHSIKNTGWKLEDGYPDSSTLNDHPQRTANDGSGSGLRFRMYYYNPNTDYVCGPMISGYKVILHNPAEIPRPTQQYFLIPLDKQSVITVKPELTSTSENLRSLSSSVRKCYFSNEKSLRFFKVYTQSNCRIECAVNVTKHVCGCVPFYMPRDDETQICGYSSKECVSNTEVAIRNFEMTEKGVNASSEEQDNEEYKIFARCNCLLSCSNLQFSTETSQTELHAFVSLMASGLFDEDNLDNVRLLRDGILSLTQVDVSFKESHFLALHRSELYGQIDFLANCGGLLGLFMGFSLFSIIEIFYYSTICLWMKWSKNKEMTNPK